jgi:hypothetical protein
MSPDHVGGIAAAPSAACIPCRRGFVTTGFLLFRHSHQLVIYLWAASPYTQSSP